MNKIKKEGRNYIVTDDILQDIITMYENNNSTTNIALKYCVNVKTIVKILKTNGVLLTPHKYRKYIFNERFFNEIDSEEKAYWLGFLFADGCVNKDRGRITVALAEVDKLHIEKFQTALGITNSLGYNAKTKSYRLVLNSQLLKDDLIKVGCVENKSYIDINIPTLNTVELYKHFLRGLFDGDGCLSYNVDSNRYKVSFMGSPRLIEFINEFLPLMLGINKVKCTQDTRFKSNFTRAVEWSGKQNVLAILEFLYDKSSIHLDRKYEKYLLIDRSDDRNRKKTGLYKIDLPDGDYVVRKLTVNECCRLQDFPDGFVDTLSKTQGYKALGNSFTVGVIEHILKHLTF